MIANPWLRPHHQGVFIHILRRFRNFWAESQEDESDDADWSEDFWAPMNRPGMSGASPVIALDPKNQFRGRIQRVIPGPVVSELLIDTAAGVIRSEITTSSAKELGLQPGVPVLAQFRATEVRIDEARTAPTADVA